jgi:hypothetical protein
VYANFKKLNACIAGDTVGITRTLEQFARAFSSADPFYDFVDVENEFQSNEKVFCEYRGFNGVGRELIAL